MSEGAIQGTFGFGRDEPRGASISVFGKTFPDAGSAESHYRKIFAEYLAVPPLVPTAGSPLASVSTVSDVSDPPFFTACPNPFLVDFIQWRRQLESGDVIQDIPPYSGDYIVDRRHDVYNFHPYHTKVPPEIIRRLIEHYTKPGELVLDGFCGSGMTGVAARESGRDAILIDLSPAATFISGANTISHDAFTIIDLLRNAIQVSEKKWGHLYITSDDSGRPLAANYFVWSDVFNCPSCEHEFPFFPTGVIHHGTKVETRSSFPCPQCAAELNVRRVRRIIEDGRKKCALVWVNAGEGRHRVNRAPTTSDIELGNIAASLTPEEWYPTDAIDASGYSARLAQLGDKAISNVSRFLSPRNLVIFSDLWARVSSFEDSSMRHIGRATLTSIFTVISERQGYFGGGGGMSGNFYMPIVRMEKNVYEVLRRKLKRLEAAERTKQSWKGTVVTSTQSSTDLSVIPDEAIDYIYVDPPFGANIIYSEVNRVIESWLKVHTNAEPEAVVDVTRERELDEYASLLDSCFSEFYRVLKPGRWITVEFHNTQAETWTAIQQAIGRAGFEVVQVGVLDKGSTTILSDIRPNAAKHDLIIAARKTRWARAESPLRNRRLSDAQLWRRVGKRLAELPVGKERTAEMLFSRTMARELREGRRVPLSTAEFYSGLRDRFREWNGMFFLPGQDPEAMTDDARLFNPDPQQKLQPE